LIGLAGYLSKVQKEYPPMTTESEKIIFAKLSSIEDEMGLLRQNFALVNSRYGEVLVSLKTLTAFSSEAASRAAESASKASTAAHKAALAAKEACSHLLMVAADEAAEAAAAAAEAAIEATAAAAAAAAACASAATLHAEESAVIAAAESAQATKRATEAAAEAVRMSHEAACFARLTRTNSLG
jgi:hypothetical protein